jgi:hypothetical protein
MGAFTILPNSTTSPTLITAPAIKPPRSNFLKFILPIMPSLKGIELGREPNRPAR